MNTRFSQLMVSSVDLPVNLDTIHAFNPLICVFSHQSNTPMTSASCRVPWIPIHARNLIYFMQLVDSDPNREKIDVSIHSLVVIASRLTINI